MNEALEYLIPLSLLWLFGLLLGVRFLDERLSGATGERI